MTMLLVLIGCASNDANRSIASVDESSCWLKKHKSKNYFKVFHKDKPLYEHWYDEAYANDLLSRSIKKGKCL